MDNNLDANMMNNIKNMVDNGDIAGAISKISPEMIQNFSKMMEQNNINNGNINNSSNTNNQSSENIDTNNLDINTIMKITSAFNKINNKNDPRSNLLYSLKPYLRESRKEKLDQYVNLLNVSKIADILKSDDKKENN